MLPLSLSHLSTNSLTYDFDAKYRCYSIKRFTIPNPMSSKRLDCVQFGLDKHIGVPVRLTAECVWTVADGHKVLFEGGQLQNDPTSQEVTVQIAVGFHLTLVDRTRTDSICGNLVARIRSSISEGFYTLSMHSTRICPAHMYGDTRMGCRILCKSSLNIACSRYSSNLMSNLLCRHLL